VFNVNRKSSSLRTATARATVYVAPATLAAVDAGEVPKGDPLPVAKVAAVQAVKNTPQIIPYCHPVRIDGVEVEFSREEGALVAEVSVTGVDRTGVEVEAMTGAAVAALALYDMLKMIDDLLRIGEVRLLAKHGGKGDFRKVDTTGLRAAVLVLSDAVAAGRKRDLSGLKIRERLEAEGLQVADYAIVADDPAEIEARLLRYADADGLDLVITTGGTGFGPRDNVPEVMSRVIEREAPGIPEAARAHGQARTPYSMLSRARAGVRGRTLIVNLPGSRGGVSDALDALFPGLPHAFRMLRGGGHADDARPEVEA
jgi:molybdenum cofactor biosynthesis protein MoaC